MDRDTIVIFTVIFLIFLGAMNSVARNPHPIIKWISLISYLLAVTVLVIYFGYGIKDRDKDTTIMVMSAFLGTLGSITAGRNSTRTIKWISFISSTLAGLILGLYFYPFPQNLIIAVFFAVLINGFFAFFKWVRRGQYW